MMLMRMMVRIVMRMMMRMVVGMGRSCVTARVPRPSCATSSGAAAARGTATIAVRQAGGSHARAHGRQVGGFRAEGGAGSSRHGHLRVLLLWVLEVAVVVAVPRITRTPHTACCHAAISPATTSSSDSRSSRSGSQALAHAYDTAASRHTARARACCLRPCNDCCSPVLRRCSCPHALLLGAAHLLAQQSILIPQAVGKLPQRCQCIR